MVAGSLGKETRIESQSTIKSVHPENLLMAVTAATALQKSKTLIEEILSFQAKGPWYQKHGKTFHCFFPSVLLLLGPRYIHSYRYGMAGLRGPEVGPRGVIICQVEHRKEGNQNNYSIKLFT